MPKKNSGTTVPQLRYERVELSSLIQDPQNVRKHSQKNLQAIAASLTRFGQQHPILVDAEGLILAGNGRVQCMIEMGWEHCDVARTDLVGDEARAFAIADNRTAELAEWDEEELAKQLDALADVDYDFALGFTDEEIDGILQRANDELRRASDPLEAPDWAEQGGEATTKGSHKCMLFFTDDEYRPFMLAAKAEMEARELGDITAVFLEMLREAGHEIP